MRSLGIGQSVCCYPEVSSIANDLTVLMILNSLPALENHGLPSEDSLQFNLNYPIGRGYSILIVRDASRVKASFSGQTIVLIDPEEKFGALIACHLPKSMSIGCVVGAPVRRWATGNVWIDLRSPKKEPFQQ
ncbi:hypothetical protein M9H77_02152 [Catharanthus roseus]|uniref:Uncharacterized protein n=1 Tax=Catharanthus roseus TaxID=4058 RepID=A0ACC0C7Q3_CATRO|nr:hypothetical protein M9H77_02152 [Catharanthus roseus]